MEIAHNGGNTSLELQQTASRRRSEQGGASLGSEVGGGGRMQEEARMGWVENTAEIQRRRRGGVSVTGGGREKEGRRGRVTVAAEPIRSGCHKSDEGRRGVWGARVCGRMESLYKPLVESARVCCRLLRRRRLGAGR